VRPKSGYAAQRCARLRLGQLIVASAALSFCVLLTVASGTANRKGGKHDGDDVEGPLDIARVHVGQSGPKLSLRLQTYGQWQARQLDGNPALDPRFPQSYLCLELVQGTTRSRNCLTTTSKGRKRLNHLKLDRNGAVESKRTLDAQIKRGGNRSFRATLHFRDAGLSPGRFGWRSISGWGVPSCAPPPPARRADARAKRDSVGPHARRQPIVPPVQCADQVPDGGGLAQGKVHRPRVVGCTHGGPLVRYHGGGRGKRVALTFDDGPSGYTSSVINVLDQHHAKGTFFVIGQEIGGRQEVMRRALQHGHEIGNHTMHHGMLPPASDLRATSSLIHHATGFSPCEFRPPGGAINLSVARGARSLGMTTVVWDVDTRDWTGASSGVIRSRATAVRGGSIVLMHDGGGNRGPTLAALPGIVSELKRRGFKLVTVSRLLGQRPIWRP
jgi:peptidoglycan/xylan/chitin deacetylase (PgdA/CDA1 family)